MTGNSILLRRSKKLLLPPTLKGHFSPSLVASVNINLGNLGYTLSPEAIRAFGLLEPEIAYRTYKETVEVLKELRGVRLYKPMYPNFPTQVAEAHEARLYLDAIFQGFSLWVSDRTGANCVWLPKYTKEERQPLTEPVELTVIRLAAPWDLSDLATALATSNTSISDTDKEDLKWLVENGYFTFPDAIPNKENLAYLGSVLIGKSDISKHIELPRLTEQIAKYMNTATDVLRLATALSSGDVSLAEDTKFHSFKRSERRALFSLLERCTNIDEDVMRWQNRWIALGERLHPGEYAKKFPRSYGAITKARRDLPVETFNSELRAWLRSGHVRGAVQLLKNRPGMFARHLDQLFQLSPDQTAFILSEFAEVAESVSTPVLLQALAHFRFRDRPVSLRVVFPKGNVAKVHALTKEQPPLSQSACWGVVNICTRRLKDRFAQLPCLGRVYLDAKLRDYLVPFSQRSASKSLRTLVRGSKIALTGAGDTVRFFIWWKDGTSTTDLDLSAVVYNSGWQHVEQIAYYQLRSGRYRGYHSGDIRSAPNGACEFIDLDMQSVVQNGGRYIVMMVNSYTHQTFDSLPECFAGWMLRQEPKSGEIFEPKTVIDKVDITSPSQTGLMPLIIDVVDRKVIWTDAAMKSRVINNVAGITDNISLIGRAFAENCKPSLYDLLWLHMSSRGVEVDSPEDADVVFSVEVGTPFELERIASEFMPNAASVLVDTQSQSA